MGKLIKSELNRVYRRSFSSVFFLTSLILVTLGAPISALLQPSVAAAEEVSDPIESFNRSMFWFNDKLYTYLLRPIAIGYDTVVPDVAQTGVHNFFSNIRSPIYMVSDLGQLKFEQLGIHTSRFLINSTLGLGGLIDVAKELELKEHSEDFGTALGYNGVGAGPYIVLPFFGPSNTRDAFGRVVDTFLNPLYYVGAFDLSSDAELAIVAGTKLLETTDDVNRARESIDLAKDTAMDYYVMIRSAYNQRRQNLIYDNKPPRPAGSELMTDGQTVDGEVEPSFEDAESAPPLIGQ